MVVELDAIDAAALHDFADQAKKALPHPRVGRVEPHHWLAVHDHLSAAIPALQHPIGVLAHHGCVGRLHQAVLKPGDHLQAAAMGGLGEAADRIEAGVGLLQGRLHRCMAGAVEGGAPAPHVGIEGVEARFGQLLHCPIDAGGVVVERAGAIGEPHADAPGRSWLALGQQRSVASPRQAEQNARRSWQKGL